VTNDERRGTSIDTRYEIRDTKSDRTSQGKPLRVAVVGPCASGKSTLVEALREAGYDARHPAQEHSYVKDMWQRLVDPDALIYLDLSHAAYRQRRPKDDAGPGYLEMQRERLAHARAHADVVVDTTGMTVEAVRELVLTELRALDPNSLRL
jgi:chloramphenicol 3-O-phosphotransferase